MEKQIEEMAFDLYQALETENIPYYEIHYLAENLYTKGYRKASDVVRKIFAEIEKLLVTGTTFYGEAIYSIGIGTFAEFKKKYESEGGE